MRRQIFALGIVGVLAACGSSEELKQLQEAQRKLAVKVAELEKKVSEKPAAPARPQVDAGTVFDIPAGNSPFKGPVDAPVVLVEFSDFQ
jgi:protein-disulfide isomerase